VTSEVTVTSSAFEHVYCPSQSGLHYFAAASRRLSDAGSSGQEMSSSTVTTFFTVRVGLYSNPNPWMGSLGSTIVLSFDRDIHQSALAYYHHTLCAPDWDYFQGHCYQLTAVGSWEEARGWCEETGSYLAAVESMQEQSFLHAHYGSGDRWIGFNDVNGDGVYQWLHSSSAFTYWGGEGGTVGSCVFMRASLGGRWDSASCLLRISAGICQQSPTDPYAPFPTVSPTISISPTFSTRPTVSPTISTLPTIDDEHGNFIGGFCFVNLDANGIEQKLCPYQYKRHFHHS